MTLTDASHYETNLKCLKVGNFYTMNLFFFQAENLVEDFAAAVTSLPPRPGVAELNEFHQGWMKGTVDRNNRKYNLRLGREIDTNFWTLILDKRVLCFEAEFARLWFSLSLPARGPGSYYIQIYTHPEVAPAFFLSRYADASFNPTLQVTNKDLSTVIELKNLSDFLHCYFELDVGNDV